MYYFIFDQANNKHLKDLSRQIEDEVVNQGIAGELVELNPTKNIDHLISDANQKGYQTLVVVGGNKLANSTAARLLRYDMVMGIIPLDESPALLEKIGVRNWQQAIIALRQRRWKYAPLGHINNTNIFLTKVWLGIKNTTSLVIKEENYTVKLNLKSASISTRSNAIKNNLVCFECETIKQVDSSFSQFWGKLIRRGSEETPFSRFCSKSLSIRTDSHIPIEVDNNVIGRTPATISVIPKALRLIVSKNTKR